MGREPRGAVPDTGSARHQTAVRLSPRWLVELWVRAQSAARGTRVRPNARHFGADVLPPLSVRPGAPEHLPVRLQTPPGPHSYNRRSKRAPAGLGPILVG